MHKKRGKNIPRAQDSPKFQVWNENCSLGGSRGSQGDTGAGLEFHGNHSQEDLGSQGLKIENSRPDSQPGVRELLWEMGAESPG